jgi:O-antigen/teichoic acid export membrane protein
MGSAVSGGGLARAVGRNLSARVIALVGVALATVLVARLGGPADVGAYALIRMLTGLVAVLSTAGLPGAMAYFLAGSGREQERLWPSLAAIIAGGGLVGTGVWLLLTVPVATLILPGVGTPVVALAAITVSTQVLLTCGKTALQGIADRRGSDRVIAAEELAFLPAYGGAVLVGLDGVVPVVVALAVADVVVAVAAWLRVGSQLGWRRGGLAREPFGWLGRPDRHAIRSIVGYGLRGQVGGLLNLVSLRLDFLILAAMAGPAVVGPYAVASKYAELLRLPGLAANWVVYPQLTSLSPELAGRTARRMVLPAMLLAGALALPMLVLAGPVIRGIYGGDFAAAVLPARILVAGGLLSIAGGVATAYLYGRGRPGLNSLLLGLGVVVTVVLDLVLIPTWSTLGAAWASTAAYLVSDGLLVLVLVRMARAPVPGPAGSVRVVAS